MAKIDFASIADPISDDAPCGPDLDMEFDMDFMNFMAGIEGDLPGSYFSFEPGALDFDGYFDQIGGFLERTRDVRLLVPLAKLHILKGNLGGFADTLEALHRLLKERWADVHPQPMDGDYELRMAYLFPLDDMPNSVLPFQHAPVFRSRRHGPITLRKWQVASGEINPREGEDILDTATIAQAFSEADADALSEARDHLHRIRDALAGIRVTCIEEAGFDAAVSLERLPKAVDELLELVDAHSEGGEAEASTEGGSPGAAGAATGGRMTVEMPTGAVKTREDAFAALHAAARYFALHEPASPVPVLLREAQSAGTKGFYELVTDLLPDHVNSAVVSLGRDPYFEVSLYTLDSRNPAPDYAEDEAGPAAYETSGIDNDEITDGPVRNDDVAGGGNDDPQPEAENDTVDPSEPDIANDEPDAPETDTTAHDDTDGDLGADAQNDSPIGNDEPDLEGASQDDDMAVTAAEEDDDVSAPADMRFVANSRPEAVALIRMVSEYYRVAEPSSPVLLILERATEMAGMGFLDILNRMLPEGALKTIPKPDEGGSSW